MRALLEYIHSNIDLSLERSFNAFSGHLGCSKRAEQVMLQYARTLVGKPFSNTGMARSILYPRTTTGESFFCAELVAAVLRKGGLMSASSNPGAATPQSLHKLYKNQAAATANPYTLRQFASSLPTQACPAGASVGASGTRFGGLLEARPQPRAQPVYRSKSTPRRRGDSPPRASFRCVSVNGELQGHGASGAVLIRR